MSKVMDLKQELIRHIHAQQTGWIYAMRVFHGKFREWFFGRKVYWLSINRYKEKKVVATAFVGKAYGDNPRYIVERIHDLLPDAEIVWLCASHMNGQVPNYVRTINWNDRKAVARELSSASIIIGNSGCFNYLVKRKDQLHIQTWHGGLGFKKLGSDVPTNNKGKTRWKKSAYDFYLSDSDHITKVYRSAFRYNGPVWKCGYPMEDALLQNTNESNMYREQYHIPQDTHIVLYAPTYRVSYRWHCQLDVSNVCNALQERLGGKWVLCVHWHHLMRQEERVLPNAIDVTDTPDMQGLVKAVDAFISDYSSSIFQAVQCRIPCFVYANDYDQYSKNQGTYFSFDEQPFPYALTEEALIDNILHYDAALWEEKWQQYRKHMGHVVTGHSVEDVAKVCVAFLNGKPKSDIMQEIPFETRF